MQTAKLKQKLQLIVCIVLITAMALFTSGCGTDISVGVTSGSDKASSASTDHEALGEGDTEFTFSVTDQNGEQATYLIHTDKTTVGDALLELELIEGEESAYGLYVKTVDGITLDYDTDGKYWAFYVNGEYAVSGVDSTEIEDGAEYSFKAE